jgi:nitrogen fixation protein NifB
MTHKSTQKMSPKTSAKVAHKPFVEYREGHCSSSNRAASEVSEHPCYSEQAHRSFGRVHVPVAPACNIQCNYCVRKYACPNENRPGVTVQVISPEQARTVVDRALTLEPRIRVIGIAGPGDALANEETLQTLEMARDEFPQLVRCMSTNGLLLPDKVDDLYRARVTSLTVTINAIDEEIGEQIYRAVRYRGKTYRGREAFELLSNNQLMGVKMAAERGMIVKVNSILMPGINDQHLVKVAKVVKELGAYIMNVMPFIPIPGAKFEDREPPSAELLEHVRNECSGVLRQFRSCTQCRADAVGVPGEDGCGGDHLQDQLYEDICTPVKGAFRAGLL